ncbi:MAG: hypothetical protein WAL53_00665 [Nitrososphaeraceae archaeon]
MLSATSGLYVPISIALLTTFSELSAVIVAVNNGNQLNTPLSVMGLNLRPTIGIKPVLYAKSQTDPA